MRNLLLALALLATPVASHCQVAPPVDSVQYAIMDDYVREYLIADWDKHAKDPIILERAYCLKYQLDFWADGLAFRVTQIEPATVFVATNASIEYSCPPGPNRAELHVHPPQTCAGPDGPCWAGGPYAYQCLASGGDKQTLVHYKEKFGMIQCSREAVVTFWPHTF
jgi:hypothetical protein